MRRRTAARPISRRGCTTVVSAGVTRDASGMSSKPTTDRSSGTRRPRSRAARTTPIAAVSDDAKIAVGGSPSESRACGGIEAACLEEVAGDDEALVEREARVRQRLSVAGEALDGRPDARRAGDEADALVAEPQEVVDRVACPDAVARVDDVAARCLGVVVDDDEWEALGPELLDVVGQAAREDDEQAVDHAVRQPRDVLALLLAPVVGRAEHEVVVEARDLLVRAGDDHLEEARADLDRQQADRPWSGRSRGSAPARGRRSRGRSSRPAPAGASRGGCAGARSRPARPSTSTRRHGAPRRRSSAEPAPGASPRSDRSARTLPRSCAEYETLQARLASACRNVYTCGASHDRTPNGSDGPSG